MLALRRSRRSSNIIHDYVCEHSTFYLQCTTGTITIILALYGRQTSDICPGQNDHVTNCAAASSLSVVQNRCDGRQTCNVRASNSVFGDPCGGTYKYLEIQYACGGNHY